jgi:hypothetical protein
VLNSSEFKLLERIAMLEARVEELSIQNESLRAGFNGSTLEIVESRERRVPASYLKNFTAAAMFPLVAGLFRIIYKRIYRLKK